MCGGVSPWPSLPTEFWPHRILTDQAHRCIDIFVHCSIAPLSPPAILSPPCEAQSPTGGRYRPGWEPLPLVYNVFQPYAIVDCTSPLSGSIIRSISSLRLNRTILVNSSLYSSPSDHPITPVPTLWKNITPGHRQGQTANLVTLQFTVPNCGHQTVYSNVN